MKGFQVGVAFLIVATCIAPILGYQEILSILNNANDLTHKQRSALYPLFHELQTQYDFVTSNIPQNDTNTAHEAEVISTQQEFAHLLSSFLPLQPEVVYDKRLPSIEDLIGHPDAQNMSADELNEFLDMQSILKDVVSESQDSIDKLVGRAQQLESNLLKINKPKIIMVILNAFDVLFQVNARISRAAYCTYSHIPQLNQSLQHLYEGIDCYTHTTALVLKVQTETVQSIKAIKTNVHELAQVYIAIHSKHSLVGKLITLLLNVSKVVRDIRDTYAVTSAAMDKLENQLPQAVQTTIDCATNMADNLPSMLKTAATVTNCILFVDNSTQVYDFMKPEAEYYT